MQFLNTSRYIAIALADCLFCLIVLGGTGGRGILISGPLIALIGLVVLLVSAYLAIDTWVKFAADINEGKVRTLEGVIGFDLQQYYVNKLIFTLIVSGEKIKLAANPLLGLKNGNRY